MVNPQLRNCRIPAFADMPHTDIFFADTVRHDRSAGRQVPGRMRHQPGGAGGRQRARRTRPACASPTCRSRPTGCSPPSPARPMSGARRERHHRHPDARAATAAPRRSPAGRARPARRSPTLPGLHRAAAAAAQPAPAGRLGDPAALHDARGRPALAGLARAGEAAGGRRADAGRARRRPHRARRRRGPQAGAGVGRDQHPREARQGNRVPRLGAQDRRRPVEGAPACRAIGSSRRCRACRTTSSPSCASTARPICRPGSNSPERKKLVEEAAPFTEEFHARLARTGFEQWFRGRRRGPSAPLPCGRWT